MICNVLMGTLHPTHSLTSLCRSLDPQILDCSIPIFIFQMLMCMILLEREMMEMVVAPIFELFLRHVNLRRDHRPPLVYQQFFLQGGFLPNDSVRVLNT